MLSVRTGLQLAYGTIITFVVIAAGTSIVVLQSISEKQTHVMNWAIPAALSSNALYSGTLGLIGQSEVLEQAQSPTEVKAARSQLENSIAVIDTELNTLQSLAGGDSNTAQIADAISDVTQNLREFSELAVERVEITSKRDTINQQLLKDAGTLTDLTESLVANATANVSNIISSLYDLVDSPDRIEDVYDSLDNLVDVDVYYANQMNNLKIDSLLLPENILELVASQDSKAAEKHQESIESDLKRLTRSIESIDDPSRRSQALELLESIVKYLDRDGDSLYAITNRLLALHKRNMELKAGSVERSAQLQRLVADAAAHYDDDIGSVQIEMTKTASFARSLMFGLAITAVFIGILVGHFYLKRRILDRLAKLNNATHQLAEGNTNCDIPAPSADELGQLATALHTFKDSQIANDQLSAANEAASKESEQIASDMQRVLSALVRGDLSQTVDSDYSEAFCQLVRDTNATVAKLASVREQEKVVEHEIQALLDAARHGDLTKHIDLRSKSGFFATLGLGMNELLVVVNQIVEDVGGGLNALAGGNLAYRITGDYDGAFEQLKDDFNKATSRLEEIIGAIVEGSEEIKGRLQQIANGNTDLSTRTETQSVFLKRTTATMANMTTSVRRNAEDSGQANTLATETRDLAEQGTDVVTRSVTAMQEISSASEEISKIIGVIDEIAFQTNLLALNASVEAARAGDQGRGFAVVASEVRNLAQRSATAAQEIKDLIDNTVLKVTHGSELVNESGHTLEEIMCSVKQVSEIIYGISTASQEQSNSIADISAAMGNMEEIVDSNASLVQNVASSSVAAKDLMDRMAEEARFFVDVDGNSEGANNPSFAYEKNDNVNDPDTDAQELMSA